MKKVWEKPKLVALVRGKPEERVLAVCKRIMVEGPFGGDCLAPRALQAGEGCKEISVS